jgi:hypothetical protein
MPIDIKKSALPEDQISMLAHKHQIAPDIADDFVAQVEVWMLDPTLETADDAEFLRLIMRHRDNAQHHTAAIIWFVEAAKRRGLSLFEAADIFIALVTPGSV